MQNRPGLQYTTFLINFNCSTLGDNVVSSLTFNIDFSRGSVYEEDLFIIHYALMLMTAKETIEWMRQKGYLHIFLLSLNGLQNGTPYAGRPVGSILKSMPLDNSLHCDILHSLHFNSVLSRCILYGEVTKKSEGIMCFSYSTPRENFRGMKRLWDS